jgi:hypothetical protein
MYIFYIFYDEKFLKHRTSANFLELWYKIFMEILIIFFFYIFIFLFWPYLPSKTEEMKMLH